MMARRVPGARIGLLLSCVVILASGLSACGGGSGTTAGEEKTGGELLEEESAAPQGGTSSSQSQRSSKPAAKVPHLEEEFTSVGAEAGGTDRSQILAVERQYLGAISDQDFRSACSLLAQSTILSLQAMIKSPKPVPCGSILPRLIGSTQAAAVARSQLTGQIKHVRIKGDQAFVIFHAPGARLFLLNLVRQSGDWRMANLTSSVVAPSAATLRGEG